MLFVYNDKFRRGEIIIVIVRAIRAAASVLGGAATRVVVVEGGGWAAGITRDATLRLCRNRRRSYARYFCAPAPVTLDDGHIAQTAFFDTADISLKKNNNFNYTKNEK